MSIGDAGLEHVQIVVVVIGVHVEDSELLPIVDPAAELLVHLAAGGVDRELAPANRAAGEIPAAPAVCVAHEQHVIVVAHDALDADHPRPGEEPVQPQPDVRAADGGAAKLHRNSHALSVRARTSGRVARNRL